VGFSRPSHRQRTAALDDLFAPYLCDFAFLMNFDAHVHLHVVPRHASPRERQGETYTDPHYGSLFGTERRPAPEALEELVEALRSRL
jgi:hypothetical protein